MWTLKDLCEHAQENFTETRVGKWVPVRPSPAGLWTRVKDAIAVLLGKADAFTWPDGQ